MFVPVACSQCGKPFQVPENTIGMNTTCPWCQAPVLALPVGAPAATTAPEGNRGLTPPARQSQPELLSLDDELAPSAPPPSPHRLRFRLLWILTLVSVVVIPAGTITVVILEYKRGHILGMEWTTFTAPDGSCSAELLGHATEDTGTESGERRYVSEGWYSGNVAWVGWRDLNQKEVQLAGAKDAWHQLAKIFDRERDRLKAKYGGSVSKDATIKFDNPLTHEVRLASPEGKVVVERMIVMPKGSPPRVYFVGMAGRFDPDGEEATKLIDSFRVFD